MEKMKNVSVYDLHTQIRSPIILPMLQVKSGDKILDLGPGTGYFSEKICKGNATTFCLDIALDNLFSIKERENGNDVETSIKKMPKGTIWVIREKVVKRRRGGGEEHEEGEEGGGEGVGAGVAFLGLL